MKAGVITATLLWTGLAKHRFYFNAFVFDRESEPGFVLARFAFVQWGECLNCMTMVFPKLLVDASRESLLKYVREIGLAALGTDFSVPTIPRYAQGTIEMADFINVARSGDIAEISFHGFALQHALEAAKSGKPINAEMLAVFRSSTTMQLKWILTLYEQG